MTATKDGLCGVPFSSFSSLLSALAQCSARPKPRKASTGPASMTFDRWTHMVRDRFRLPTGTTLTLFRLLFPENDRRRIYGMQEPTLARLLCQVLGFPDNRLTEWKAAANGSLGRELASVLDHTSSSSDDSLTITEVDTLLDELAATCPYSHASIRAGRSGRTRKEILRSLYRRLSPEAACFLTHIILKDLAPVICPPREAHYTTALLNHNTASYTTLTIFEAMRIWDPSRLMLRSYQVRATIEDVAAAFESTVEIQPSPGFIVEIPKSRKGLRCSDALASFGSCGTAWGEIKYDGERAQIHVQIGVNGLPSITIFSKSKRDSTLDRFGVHHIIRNALRLSGQANFSTNIILDAEMVAFNNDHIDEFWRIRSLIGATAHGVRARHDIALADNAHTQNSLVSTISESGHLGLVFFDILYLDSKSLLSKPYSERRTLLESIIQTSPGEAILAERFPINLHESSERATRQLARIFSAAIADHQEGIVIKGEDSSYNDFRQPWVKLKKDYIPGYGDALDLVVVGASWEKERGASLKVGTDVFTTFYLASLEHRVQMCEDAPTPHFQVYFTSSYGLSREQLEEANFLLKNSDHQPYNPTNPPRNGLCYTYRLFSGIPPPDIILCVPLLVEVFGAGFTKAMKSMHYELRFPRITKIFRQSERSWMDCTLTSEVHRIARDSVGRDRTSKDIADWTNDVWGMQSSPKAKCPKKRRATADIWEAKLLSIENLDTSFNSSARKRRRTVIRPLSDSLNSGSPQSSQSIVLLASPPKSTCELAQPLAVLSDCFVWFPRTNNCVRPPWKTDIPINNRLHSCEALLIECGWRKRQSTTKLRKRGLVFLDLSSEDGLYWKAHIEKVAQGLDEDDLRANILLFDSRTFQLGENAVEDQAIHIFC